MYINTCFCFLKKSGIRSINNQPLAPLKPCILTMYLHVLHPYQSNEKVVLKPRNQLNYSFCLKRKTETAPTMSVSFQDATDPPDRFRTHFGPGACVQPATPPQLIPRRPRKRPEISWSLSNRFRDAKGGVAVVQFFTQNHQFSVRLRVNSHALNYSYNLATWPIRVIFGHLFESKRCCQEFNFQKRL